MKPRALLRIARAEAPAWFRRPRSPGRMVLALTRRCNLRCAMCQTYELSPGDALRPDELARFRALMPHAPLLLPGYGFQGGSAEGLAPAFDELGRGALVNSSRGILHAHERPDLAGLPHWKDRTRRALEEMRDALSAILGG